MAAEAVRQALEAGLQRLDRNRPERRLRILPAVMPLPLEIYLNVAVGGLLTGLIYGLMALGLSVIFGVVRVVNFAHGEMMTIAMYLADRCCSRRSSSIRW